MEHFKKIGIYKKLIFLIIGLLTVFNYGCDHSKSSTKTEHEQLIPVYFQTIEVDGFWKEQMKKLIEEWLPHCIEQMGESTQTGLQGYLHLLKRRCAVATENQHTLLCQHGN